ncbi:polymorphic toxin type 47 domain-containing protein [Kroppenstedtia sanguinis]|uniref:Polymorphic toxin type 47 domain-containing protein n=1 Tax=Kroppenstedtia sanguinis TaxID=1380684 RepID=A0ABW4CAV7_9BACL
MDLFLFVKMIKAIPERNIRGKDDHHGDATREAFEMIEEETGIKKSEFEAKKWAKSKDGKSFVVEWRHKDSGAEVSMDKPHFGFDKRTGEWATGPDAPHIGWQTSGKRERGGRVRGHILVDDVPTGRPPVKE